MMKIRLSTLSAPLNALFPLLPYKIRLWQLRRDRDKNRLFYNRKIKEARREGKSNDEIIELTSAEMELDYLLDDGVSEAQSRLLCEQAGKLYIPVPDRNENMNDWEQSSYTGRLLLTKKAALSLRKEIREEEKYRRERLYGLITILIGLIGSLIGLVSALR